ncbi:MAG: hypothetical protein ACI9RY_000069 [Reinekea sp.]|jgi:hypothetical protein
MITARIALKQPYFAAIFESAWYIKSATQRSHRCPGLNAQRKHLYWLGSKNSLKQI